MGVVRGPCLSVLSTAIRGTCATSRGCIELRGLANRSEGLGGPGSVDKSEGLGGRAGLEPVDKCEGLGAGLAWALSIKVRDWAGRARLVEVRGGRAGRHGQTTGRYSPTQSGTEHPCFILEAASQRKSGQPPAFPAAGCETWTRSDICYVSSQWV